MGFPKALDLVRLQVGMLNVSMVQGITLDLPKVQIQVQVLVETLCKQALRVYRMAWQSSKLPDEVRFLGGALK